MSARAYFDEWLPSHSNTKLYTRTYRAVDTKAVVIFLHGFAEHVGRYEHVHPKWPERGITLFTYDARGFGRTALDKANKSKDSSYGKTCWNDQFMDIDWAISHVTKEFPAAPLFLMGHSMGGGTCLAFVTRQKALHSPDSVKLISGVICSSPLLQLVHPVPQIQIFAAHLARPLLPYLPLPAPVRPDILSHDPIKNKVLEDPLIRQWGTISGLADMLVGGEEIVAKHYKYWPKTMPILIVHGTADDLTCHEASKSFINKIEADDKKISLYEGGYHELANEPDGVWEKFTDECISWVEDHILQTARL